MIVIILILGAAHLLWVCMAWREHRRRNPKTTTIRQTSARQASGRIRKRLTAKLRRRAAALPAHW